MKNFEKNEKFRKKMKNFKKKTKNFEKNEKFRTKKNNFEKIF